uniref:Transposase (Putative), gypsy type n=1 Tax=Tanacetum cinerariifolium TaxID=118510 RepID=A0A6L2MPS7_TANCI|nr:hypothetical protein [Tanacetum cinerariifolium]
MDLLSFIQTVDPTKVRVAERQRMENKPRLLESIVGRVVSLLPIAPARASSELEASVDKLFDKGASGDGQGTDIQPVPVTTDTIVEDVAPFVISSDSSHHSGANIAEAEVDSIVRAPVVPSLFGVGSSSTRRTDSVPDGFFDVSVCDFLIGDIRTIVDPDSDLQKVYVSRWSATNRFGLDDSRICLEMLDEFGPPKFFASVRGMDHDQLFTEFNVEAARQISLNAESQSSIVVERGRSHRGYPSSAEVFKFKAVEQSLRGEVEVLRDQSAALEREKNELSVKVTDLSASVKVREHEVTDLDAQVTAVKLQNDNLADQVYADFVDIALHLEEKFYSHLITTISEHQWLLTYGMELAVVKCLNSTEYLSALGAAISKAVEKGMQEGLSVGTTHGAEGRKLVDVAAYNPSAEADHLSDLQRLQNVNFSLIVELKSNKDAIIDTIMNLLHLDDVLAERIGLIKSQPHVNQLMVPIHHSPDQRIVGASALSLSLEVSHSRVKKMRENIPKHVSALRGVFVPLSEPLSAIALEGMEGNSGSTHDTTTTLSKTFVFASTVPPISTDDYEVAHVDGQGVPL